MIECQPEAGWENGALILHPLSTLKTEMLRLQGSGCFSAPSQSHVDLYVGGLGSKITLPSPSVTCRSRIAPVYVPDSGLVPLALAPPSQAHSTAPAVSVSTLRE